MLLNGLSYGLYSKSVTVGATAKPCKQIADYTEEFIM